MFGGGGKVGAYVNINYLASKEELQLFAAKWTLERVASMLLLRQRWISTV